MSGIKDQDNIEQMRERLYARGSESELSKRPALTPTEGNAKEAWDIPKQEQSQPPRPSSQSQQSAPNSRSTGSAASQSAPTSASTPSSSAGQAATASAGGAGATGNKTSFMKMSRKKVRLTMLISAVAVFILSLGVASAIIMSGANTISGENITLELNGPQAVGGGEELNLQVGIGNQNAVPIKAATLVVEYPSGSRSAGEDGGQDLFKERIPLDTIRSGEVVNVPIEAIVFGEENEEKAINASIEYRVEGSNQVFFKEAEPYVFQISSVPLVLSVDTVDRTSSGQSVDITLTVRSNAQSPLQHVLVDATYPAGFSYESAEPEPVSGNDTWYIESLAPEEETEIVLTGVVSGSESDELAVQFDAGTAADGSARTLETVLATANTDITIEAPFIDVALLFNGESGSIVSGEQEVDRLRGEVVIDNNLSASVYDIRAEATLSGSGLRDEAVSAGVGFYNSTNDTLEWDQSSARELSELPPNTTETLSFSVNPRAAVTNSEISVVVNVYAKRIDEERAVEQLIGTAEGTMRFSGSANLLADVGRGGAGFSEIGPIPPVAEEETTYTIGLRAEAGMNALEGAEVAATLPSYVLWREQTTGDGRVSFNPVSRQLTWDIGDIAAEGAVTASFQVGFIPSVSQTGDRPELMSAPQFIGTDKFTNERITARSERITTELPEAAGFTEGSGMVQPRD